MEGTTVIDAEMTANELARKTVEAEIFSVILDFGFVLLGTE